MANGTKTILQIITALLCLFPLLVCHGQDLKDSDGHTVTPYYLNFNTAQKSHVFDVRGEFLHLQYNDIYGKSKQLPLSIRNWKNEPIADMKLTIAFGLNNFDIRLSDHAISLATNEVYSCVLVDETGKKYTLFFKYLLPVAQKIEASIFIKPNYLECNNPAGVNLVEFYGQVTGGKAPYQLNWYVLNKSRTDFLYQPSQFLLQLPGYTTSIQVDQSPGYYVLLYVKDACGNEQTSTVQMGCEENKKQINTVFFESVDKALSKSKGITN